MRSGSITFFCIGIAFLLIVPVSNNELQESPTNTVIMDLDESEMQNSTVFGQAYRINLSGYWNKGSQNNIGVHFETIGLESKVIEYLNENLNLAQDLGSTTRVLHSEDEKTWNGLISSIADETRTSLPVLVTEKESANAEIRIVLTSEYADSKKGKTISRIDSVGHITSAEITIYDAGRLHDEGLLLYVVRHELGHALGMRHSDNPQSIMYPRMIIMDGEALGQIGSCEEQGISTLYVNAIAPDSIACDLKPENSSR